MSRTADRPSAEAPEAYLTGRAECKDVATSTLFDT